MLEVKGLTSPMLRDVSFTVRKGEVLGIGVWSAPAGPRFCARSLAPTRSAGTVTLDGKALLLRGPGDAVRAGIGLVPEDRKQQGVLLDMPILTNAVMTPINPYLGPLGILRDKAERRAVQDLREGLRLKAASLDAEAGTLSGGNQQKVALDEMAGFGREVLLLDEPTRGVDVGAKVERIASSTNWPPGARPW